MDVESNIEPAKLDEELASFNARWADFMSRCDVEAKQLQEEASSLGLITLNGGRQWIRKTNLLVFPANKNA